jgi:CBS domain-containing protein
MERPRKQRPEAIVAGVMTRDPVTASSHQTLASALQVLRARRVSLLPVVEDGKLVGMLTEHDACWDLSDLEQREVGTVMDPHPESVLPEANLREAARALLVRERPAFCVVARGQLVGLVTPRDLLRASLDALDAALPAVTTVLTVPQGGRLALAEISSLIRAHGGDLLATVREPIEGEDVAYRLRISAPNPDALIELLEVRGHRVVTSTLKRRSGVAPSAAASPCG